jgi:hypothetical protein
MILLFNEAMITWFFEFIAACHDCHWYGGASEYFRLFLINFLIHLPRALVLVDLYFNEHKMEKPLEFKRWNVVKLFMLTTPIYFVFLIIYGALLTS